MEASLTPFDLLARRNIRTLISYRSARGEFTSGVLLDANENPHPAPGGPDRIALNRYPDPHQRELRRRVGEMNGVRPENIFFGAGSDEVIDLLIRIFCEPGSDAIMIAEPTYGMYRVAAAINDIAVMPVGLTGSFQLDTGAMLGALHAGVKLIFCCSPNNPTGNLLRREDILALCAQPHALVVLDEAYIDFAGGSSLAPLLAVTPNLVVLRTFSKGWGMAGLRLGYALAGRPIIDYLFKVKPPYNIGVLAEHYALAALARADEVHAAVGTIIAERRRLADALERLPAVERIYPSDANFLLVRCRAAGAICRVLAERGIIVRDRSSDPMLDNCIRITVGTADQNDLLLATLKEIGL